MNGFGAHETPGVTVADGESAGFDYSQRFGVELASTGTLQSAWPLMIKSSNGSGWSR